MDTNVLIDVISDDPHWAAWSAQQLDVAAIRGDLVINDVVYAELSNRFETIEALDDIVAKFGLVMAPIPRASLFLAGKSFQKYRRLGGSRTGLLPDLFIGAHAAVARWTLLTRDVRRYQTYFPAIDLVVPANV